MPSLRLWILGVAFGSFATGLIVGGVVTAASANAEAAPFEDDYLADLRERYGLSSDQARLVRMVLRKELEEEMAILLGAQQNQFSPELMARVLLARDRTNKRIRKVLDDEQRARYDEACRPPGTAPADSEKR